MMTEASKSEEIIHINSRLIIGGQKCTIKYIGPVEGKSGTWHGVEWDNQERGKNSGLGLFKTKIEGAGSFIKISSPDGLSFTTSKKPIEVGGSFLKAVKEKYIGSAPTDQVQLGSSNGVIVETVGWEKMQRKLAKLDSLRELGLADVAIRHAVEGNEIKESLPLVQDIDLSRNLFPDLDSLAQLCKELPSLRILRLNYNRFASPMKLFKYEGLTFPHIQVLTMVSTLVEWDDILSINEIFPGLLELHLGWNNWTSLSSSFSFDENRFRNIKVVDLEHNMIQNWKEVENLGLLPCLDNLNIANNQLSDIVHSAQAPFKALSTINISNNSLSTWTHIDQLNRFENLVNIRVAGNPVLETVDIEHRHVFLVARLGKALRIGGSHISERRRFDAELYYLSQIHLELDTLVDFHIHHPRYSTLCEMHGTPNSKKVDRTIADSLLVVFLVHPDTKERVEKKISKRTTLRIFKTIVARTVFKNNWQSASRGRLIWLKEDGEEYDLTGMDDTKSLEYIEAIDNSIFTIKL